MSELVGSLRKRPSKNGQTRAIRQQAFLDARPLTTAQVFRKGLVINLAVLIEDFRRREFTDWKRYQRADDQIRA